MMLATKVKLGAVKQSSGESFVWKNGSFGVKHFARFSVRLRMQYVDPSVLAQHYR